MTTRGFEWLLRWGRGGATLGTAADDLFVFGARDAPWLARRRGRRRRSRAGAEGAGPSRDELHSRLWQDAAAAIGATVARPHDAWTEVRRGESRVRFLGRRISVDDPVALAVAGDKPLVASILAEAGIPSPEGKVLPPPRVRDAERLLLGGAVVVKPAGGTGVGMGVTGGVRTRDDLLRAALRAARRDPRRLVVERHVEGEEYRVLVLDGRILACTRRRPPTVIGDGTTTIADLIVTVNKRRREQSPIAAAFPLRVSLDTMLALRHQGLGMADVPARGRVVQVASGTTHAGPREGEDVPLDDAAVVGVHEAAMQAARALSLVRLMSVEIITPAADRPLTEAGGAVLEVNSTPGILQHYVVADPPEVPVAERLLDALLS